MPTRFDERTLRARLAAAKAGSADGQPLGWRARFAGLASPAEPPFLPDHWPTDSYSEVPRALQRQVLDWLIQHHGELRGYADKSWREAWIVARVACAAPTAQQAATWAQQTLKRPHSRHSRALFDALAPFQVGSAVTVARLRHLSHHQKWGRVVRASQRALDEVQETPARTEAYRHLVEALLARGRVPSEGAPDAERAYHTLRRAQAESIWPKGFNTLLLQAIEDAGPQALRAGRGVPLGAVRSLTRGATRFGKWFGKKLGGREAKIPRDEKVIASAPTLLSPGQVAEALDGAERPRQGFAQSMAQRTDLEAAALAGTLGLGGAWTLAQIDDQVLDALTFASAGKPEAFTRLQEIAADAVGSAGATTRLSGYVAEQQVALDLAREGHVVEVPDSASQPGYDLLVDGNPVQVKCSLDADYVLEHFERYPDVPVIVNAELAEALGDHPLVWVDPALSHAEVAESTQDSLEALANFGDADDLLPIPFLSVAFAAYRNYGDLQAGHIDGEAYAKRVAVDAAARAAGGGAGAALGGAIGSVGGPVGTVIGTMLGSYLGSVAGGTGADAINQEALCDRRDAAVAALAEFGAWFAATPLPTRVAQLAARRDAVAAWAERAHAAHPGAPWVPAVHAAAVESHARATALAEWFATHLADGEDGGAHAGWVALREAPSFLHPELRSRLATVSAALDAYTATTQPAGAPQPA